MEIGPKEFGTEEIGQKEFGAGEIVG